MPIYRDMAQRILTVLALVVAVAAAGASAVALTHRPAPQVPSSIRSQLASLRGQVATANAQLTTLSKNGSVSTQDAAAIARLKTCLPELTNLVGGLTPQVSNGQVSLSQDEQVSSYCSSLLYGSSGQ